MRLRLLFALPLITASCAAPADPAARPPAPEPPLVQEGPAAPDPALPSGAPADLVVLGERIWTGTASESAGATDFGGAGAGVAVVGERIAAVGTRAEIERWVGPETRRVEVPDGLILPGFIDAHVHFLSGGLGLASVQLRDAATPEQFIARIRDFARTVPAGTWITHGDWDHEQWGGELPRRSWIDSVTPDHPVWISRLDGHMALANTAALRTAGVENDVAEVQGGAIERDEAGRLTGLLRDNAMDLVSGAVPEPTPETMDRALEAAMDYVSERGVTSLHDMGGWSDWHVYRRAHRDGDLRTRVYLAVPLAQWRSLADTVAEYGRGDQWLRIGGLKGFVDGSLGSHTAAFLEPFTDAPGDRGLLINDPEDLYRWTSSADSAGLQVMVHAIGDRANRLQLDIFERVARENGLRDRRFRIEHAQHIHPADIPRFAEIGVIPSMQPYHAIDDGRWADRVIGAERARTTYAFRSLLDADARLAFGSDWSVAPATPLEGIYAAVTRRTLDGAHPGGWVPSQKVTVEEALRAYTRGAAYAGFAEERVGTLEPGKLADMVVVDRDLFAVPPAAIRDAQVVATIVGGEVVFRAR